MTTGLLVTNGYLKSDKFDEIYHFLYMAGKKVNIKLEKKSTTELIFDITNLNKLDYDFVIFWDKDIKLAKYLENIGFKVFNSSRAIQLCDDKAMTFLHLKDIPMPKTILVPKTFENIGYNTTNFLKEAGTLLSYPLVLKECESSFGLGVYLINKESEIVDILNKNPSKSFIMQEFIASCAGHDIRVNVVGGEVVSSMERYNTNDFRSNIAQGGSSRPYTLSQKESEIAVSACKQLGLDFAGIDLLSNGENCYLCEVNSNAQFKGTLLATGVNVADEILKYISTCKI